ncbi:putative cardiolipin synthase [Variovorax boronicumulans]|uniref:phospholipase D family protein n=1 Tax=Variovorax boronicumulans TaxID=436515 RepID=UPI00278A4DF7|nr:phospholipase D family protein [Variovorax boronicumulans]MDQ0016011.1 putative cardiolipin synthase [Variovorax boronicumulans]
MHKLIALLIPALRAPALLLIALALTGCAGLPPRTPEPPTEAIAASPATALGRAAISLNTPPDGLSSLRPLIEASYALDARLELMRRAQSSLDVQTYQLGNDKTGRLLLRELRDAARRGVRVRLLLDDFYTAGMDRLLLGLAAEPNAEVRLFNPFVNMRDHSSGRWLEFFGDFRRLNHRMHNKLFVADGAMAIAGGRNLADEYFLRSESANFIDFEVLMAGPVVRESAAIFDTYWNSDVVYPLQRVAGTSRTPDELKSAFETDTSPRYAPPPDPLAATDLLGDPPLAAQLANIDEAKWMRAEAHATADSPNKALGVMAHPTESLAQRFHEMLATAQSNVVVISPYFIPGDEGMARIRMGREHGINITVITNSLADSDEPLVNINYNRYRVDMLKLGVNLYEVSTQQLRRSGQFRDLLKKARGRLHAKLALVDRQWVLLGSMNLDPRSALLNTEFGVRVRSFDLTQALLFAYQLDDIEGVYRVVLKPDGQNVQWIGTGDVTNEVLDSEPDSSMLTRLQLLLFSWFVPTDQL